MTEPNVLREGRFTPKVKTYWLLSPTIALTCTIILIPLVPVYLIIAGLVLDRWLAAMRCTLTERTLVIKKGLINRVESTVPLEKITDLQLYQGPIMRLLDLKGFRVETAGQSTGAGSFLVNMVGIIDTDGFREAVLEQRDHLAHSGSPSPAAPRQAGEEDLVSLTRDIRDSLRRIETRLEHQPE
ncbi:MAG: PH domain-containing protein [Phycisphaerales bacterium]|nr:PH domain-containing protein [Phycisphaerales bacterium]